MIRNLMRIAPAPLQVSGDVFAPDIHDLCHARVIPGVTPKRFDLQPDGRVA